MSEEKLGWIVTEYDENKVNIVYPEGEIHDLAYIIHKEGWLAFGCPCIPVCITGNHWGCRTIVHSSFDGREYVERVQDIINGKP